ncbi:MAG: hypothetical protein JEY94_10020 [Melioribacteraceae bacterium]|nr:hypothetical protein [Melioribacteraceae bacterium]
MFSKNKIRLEYLRNLWGREIAKYRDFDLISSYLNLQKLKDEKFFVDDKTRSDLDLNDLFVKLDRNISCIGQQYLYYILHKYESDETLLKKRFSKYLLLQREKDLREKIQLQLFGMSDVSSNFVAYLVLSSDIPNSKYYRLFYLCSILSFVLVLLSFYNGTFVIFALAALINNIILNKIFSKKIYNYFTGFSSLNSLINSALSLSKIKNNVDLEELGLLNQKSVLLKSLKRKLGYFVIDKENLNDLAIVAIEYLNMFLLFDIIAYYRSVDTLLENQQDIKEVFDSVASLDSSISIASYLEEIEEYCNPHFNNSNTILFKDLRHPLIDDAIPNTVAKELNSVLITGSNMAGKTTFIKTVGVNFILSQTMYFSLSKMFSVPKLIVKSSIRRNENLEEGKSYFFVEIEALNEFIKLSDSENNYLFLIDEIFRGTNTIERLASSTAVLKYLNHKNLVFVTTHDIELQDLLGESFNMFHFSERVENNKFYFDYKIQEGACSSGNAIKLLDIMNYPDSVVEESNYLAVKLLKNKKRS